MLKVKLMKKIIILLTIPISIYSQVPLGFSFQTIIRDSDGKVQKNQATGIQFTVLEVSATGTVVFSETHTVSTNDFGIINLTIGTGTVTEGVFADIVWGSNIHFLKTEIDPTGGNTYTISTTSQLMSVPYAMYAMKADTTLKTNISDVGNEGDMLYFSGSKWNKLSKGNQGDFLRVNEVGLPTWQSFAGFATDIDGNSYPLVKIGNQFWFQENLKTSKYNDGTLITEVTDNTEWSNLTTGAWCNYNNNISYDSIYGKLYNWYAVETGKLCPLGFHVPTDEEWTLLTDYLGGESVAGGKLKEVGTVHWNSPNEGATDEVGFTALPGGCSDSGSFGTVRYAGYWWSATPSFSNLSWARGLYNDSANVNRGNSNKINGFSVRCLWD